MDAEAIQAELDYELSIETLAHLDAAREIALKKAQQDRQKLKEKNPMHQLLQEPPEVLSLLVNAGFSLHPLGALIELFLHKDYRLPGKGLPAQKVLLAASMAVTQAGAETASVPEILRRANELARVRSHERER